MSPVPFITSPSRTQRTLYEVLLPETLTSVVLQSLSCVAWCGSFAAPLAMQTLVVVDGMAKGMPGISILAATSHHSPGAPTAAVGNAHTNRAKLSVNVSFMMTPFI